MSFSADRVSALFFFLGSVLFYFVIIPGEVEFNDSGAIMPSTLPNVLCWVVAFFSAVLFFKPSGHKTQGRHETSLALVYFGLICLALYAMTIFGYVAVSPFFALMLMLLIGERRPLWLGVGVIAAPATIWFVVEYLLGRTLP